MSRLPKPPITPHTSTTLSLDAFVEDRAKIRFAENQEIARAARALRATLREKEGALTDVTNRLALYEQLEHARLAPPTWLTPGKPRKSHTAIPCLLLTDIHFDEVIKPEQVDGVNAYNRRIAEGRIRRAFEGAIKLARDYLSGVTYEGFQLFLGGDLMSGVIHEELRETNEAQVMESVLALVEPLSAGVKLLADTFGHVHVAAVTGNHGRNTKKPQAKNRARGSFDWLTYQLIGRELRADKRVTMQISEAADTHVKVYGVRYALTHGDQFRGGSGISGALAPLLLGVHRKTRRDAASGNPWDVLVMGHWHQSYFLKGLIVGGSLVGYSEYAYAQNFPYEEPQAAFWLTTPERGIGISAPVFVQDRAAEGW